MPPQPGFSPIAAPAPKQPWSTGKTVGIIIAIVLACALVLGAGGCALLSLLTSSPAAVGRPTVNNPLSGYNWRASDGSYLMLADNGTFIWYESERDQTDMFYSGRYAVYFGEDAVEHVTGDLASYGVTRSELDQLFARSDETMSVDSFCCLVLDNQQLVVDGENTLKEPTLTPCYGFYYEDEEFLDVANMNTGSYWAFTKA